MTKNKALNKLDLKEWECLFKLRDAWIESDAVEEEIANNLFYTTARSLVNKQEARRNGR